MTDPKTVTVQERLRTTVLIDPSSGLEAPINPDGPEAADLLDRCKAALEAARKACPFADQQVPQIAEVLTQLNGGRNA